ncbi:MAG: monoheme cytochrome c [Roseibaca calidilacus]|uniref:Cytochrome c2 n=2 Tax=Roseibaca calidilacus TaxID=1666912 RepID=A0A0P7WL41_9RHOB|nr:MAG: monoheme cytochrome c [Roseibaca calidilacus]CUX82976.1 Cytochrome c2 [Roseibaca calidilacus]
MPPRKDPIESMSPAEKLLRVGVIGGTALLLVLATVSSFRDGPGQNGAPQVAEAPAAEEDDSEEAASADDAPEPAPEDEEESVETAEAEPEAEADAEAEEETASAEDDAARGDEDSEVETAEAEDDSAQAETASAEAPAEESGSDNWLEESPLLASADIDAGESAFRQCSACHQYNAERNAGGPHLVGIVGREVAAVENWRYSDALQDAGGVWTPERLEEWLTNPDDYLPGNRMAYPGVRDEQERIDIIGFLAAQADG